MNEHFFSNDTTSPLLRQNSWLFNSELVNNFHKIIRLTIKSLNAQACLIALANNNEVAIVTNHQNLNQKVVNLNGTIFEKSLSEKTVSTSNVSIDGTAYENKSYASNTLCTKTGITIGFLAIVGSPDREYTPEELSLIDDFANLAAETFERHDTNQKLQEVFTDFVHKTVHDLKNPFTTISLTTELLKRKADDTKLVTSFSQRLENANNKVLTNLERLKSAFPLTSENFKLNIQKINVAELLLEVKKQINIEAVTTNDLNEKIYGDYRRLTEALVQLTIHLSVLSKNLTYLSLKAYIKEDQAIFAVSNAITQDKQIENAESADSTHLSIARKLIQMHYGEVFCISYENPEKYTFYIALPLPS